MWFGEPVHALADVRERPDVVIGKVAVQNEAAQGVALPSRAVLGPLKEFFENGHAHVTESRAIAGA